MNTKRYLLTLFTFSFMIFSSAEIVNFLPATLKGQVTDARTGKPVVNVHLFIVQGEEEVFSSAKGEFSFKTWMALPAVITVKHQLYKTQHYRVDNETDRIAISLIPLN